MQDNGELPKCSELLSDPLKNGMSFEEAVKALGPDKLQQYMEGQYKFLQDHCDDIQEQLRTLRAKVDTNNTEIIARVERLLVQLTNHMTIIRQMIDMINTFNNRLVEQEQAHARQELAYANMVDRQNKFAISLANLQKSGKEIVGELEDVRSKEEAHSALEWKLFTVFTIGISIIIWLLTGDNFAKILIAIKNVTG